MKKNCLAKHCKFTQIVYIVPPETRHSFQASPVPFQPGVAYGAFSLHTAFTKMPPQNGYYLAGEIRAIAC